MSNPPPAGAPAVGREVAASLCERLFFRPARLSELDGYEDANFRVEDEDGRRFVLKLARGGEKAQAIRFEQRVLKHLVAADWPGVPRLVSSRHGRLLEPVDDASGQLDARMLTWVEGVPMAKLARRSPGLLAELGWYLGGLDRTLVLIDPGEERVFDWDLAQLATRRPPVEAIESGRDRELVEAAIEAFLERRKALLPGLPRSLIHSDANDHNVIVSSERASRARLVGLIDFGDLVVTETIYEVAVAAAYACLELDDPWSTVHPLIVGYDEVRPLTDEELQVLYPAVRARLALSLAKAAQRRRRGTADAYALVSEHGARAALRSLRQGAEDESLATLRRALGREGAE